MVLEFAWHLFAFLLERVPIPIIRVVEFGSEHIAERPLIYVVPSIDIAHLTD
jgi:hypothetical protein